MNFDKFKSVLPKHTKITTDDANYIEHLNSLKEPRPNETLKIISTIAAAVVIVLAVGLWALIGRGIRGTGTHDPIISPPAAEGVGAREQLSFFIESTKEYELTGKVLYDFENAVFERYKFAYIPIFTETEPLTELKIAEYHYILNSSAEINEFAKDLFEFEGKFGDITEDIPALIGVDVEYKIQSIAEHTLSSGHRIISIVYTMDGYQYTLDYIAKNEIDVDWFYMHTKNGPEEQAEPTVESEFQSIAKKYCFEQLYDFERGTLPSYTESKIYIARFAQIQVYENKDGKQIYGYPIETYKTLMTDIFSDYDIPDEITPIDELTGPKYWMYGPIRANDGTLFAALDNESGMDYYFDFNSYVEGEYNGQKTITVTYTATDTWAPNNTSIHSVTYTTADGVHPDKIIEKKTLPDDTSVVTQIHYPNNMAD